MSETREELVKRHNKEKKDLQNKITGMKKQATKSQRKEVNSKCVMLQENLQLKQDQELEDWETSNCGAGASATDTITTTDSNGDIESHDSNNEITPEELLKQLEISNGNQQEVKEEVALPQQPRRKRNRQKERLARREAEIQKMKAEAMEESKNDNGPNLQKIEQEAINNLCLLKDLNQFDIKPDGHCLFASILDQLKQRHQSVEPDLDVYKLRSIACNYIKMHENDFLPYLFDEIKMEVMDINEYVREMETTAKWGGEIEIMALSKEFDCPISILFSDRPVQVFNEEGTLPELKLVYYKHSFALGEHYNSLHDNKQ
ncbi:hypothetical protein KAFR_0A02020 [Kazachstania africana CBS 2517]|uniref:OTU domain-containing protein n=1 Tax=Kazachstania africana (strain ATCC 22294 / BCRC 22015 / CBS 2517 / CECT 1963 / NBRC 1671 / NRRL Y-8276) TaxID=1071382 RepID=H2AMP0_KAZAF|nr:hypothetical protein KAFR_0A02020 [Kazachstania africana CBS 2517]CCF55640.1 hypothetical protein KAFR_0A02020 [Kazachstania africana CBS 2517]